MEFVTDEPTSVLTNLIDQLGERMRVCTLAESSGAFINRLASAIEWCLDIQYLIRVDCQFSRLLILGSLKLQY